MNVRVPHTEILSTQFLLLFKHLTFVSYHDPAEVVFSVLQEGFRCRNRAALCNSQLVIDSGIQFQFAESLSLYQYALDLVAVVWKIRMFGAEFQSATKRLACTFSGTTIRLTQFA